MSNKIKICKICGDKSIGFHFNAITCESCKSFFRRNSQKKSDHFRCYLGNNCIINIETRNSCKKCRLDKCFSVGMSTDFFHTEEQKRMRKVRNKNTETMSPKSDGISEDSMVSTSSLSSEADAIIAEIFNEESHVSDNESMGYASDTTAYKCELSVVPIVRPIGDCIPNFNELEVQKLRELLNAINSMIAPTADTDTPIVLTNEWDAKNAMIMKNDLQIANIVKMSKCLTTFNALCENDRIVLITYGSMEIGVLRDFIRDIGLDYDSDPMIINLTPTEYLYLFITTIFANKISVRFTDERKAIEI
ncbi:unnamed protein product [Medioppia subpectinata]|uniref:Nuclear receptor domain-containing protein n=1 Tax=Medioppia subpectinata TaxID=1979941 RepID=A0A7R9Q1S9_9ACAR|nr:unnamed protein product [Medioppia subpectinata]CAG2109579.1 unnamed protein product [Medioppia subpectinata]